MGVTNDYVKKARENLSKYLPDEFPFIKDERIAPGVPVSRTACRLAGTVARRARRRRWPSALAACVGPAAGSRRPAGGSRRGTRKRDSRRRR